MATAQTNPIISYPANSDLSASQFCGVTGNSSGYALLPSAGGPIIGVLQNDPDAQGEACQIQCYGVAPMKLGGTVAINDFVKVDTAGRAVTASAGEVAAGAAMGYCLKGGAINNIGEILILPGAVNTSVTGIDALTTAAACSLYTETTTLAITGTIAYTLADGLYAGQKKRVRCISAASTPLGTLTLSDAYGSESLTHVFTAAGQELLLEWTSTGWKMVDKNRAGVEIPVIGTTVLTGHDMALVYSCSVTGTVVSATTKGIPDGTVAGEICIVACSTAASIPVGSIAFSGLSLANAALVDLQAIGATTDTVTLQWTGAAWLVIANSGITLA